MPRTAPARTEMPDKIADDVTRMVWMGLDGRGEDLARYVRRVLPKWQPLAPELAGRLEQLLAPRSSGPVRRASAPPGNSVFEGANASGMGMASISAVGDFLSIEEEASMPVEPVWGRELAAELDGLVRERMFSGKLAEAGLQPTHTVVFTGPPGVGKTLAARWLARALNLPLAVLNLGAVMSSFLGRTGSNLRQVMDFARRQPCVLLLDELDAIAKRRDDQSDIGELKRLVTVLLQELDSWPGSGLLVATTNHEQLIDPAVWRRFQRRIVFPLPGAVEQAELLRQQLGEFVKELDGKFVAAAGEIGSRLTQAELTLISERALRDHILATRPLRESLEANLANAVAAMPLAQRKPIGVALRKLGIGQREIHRLTGLARETVRKGAD